MSDIAIRVENLSKYYKLGVINSGTLSRDLQSWLYKKIGKEDPNKKIGASEIDIEGFWALKDLNFDIKKGDRVGIIGRNGAGKSTLLKMLSQISSPTIGKIYIDGKIASLLEVGTGFNPELTGRENIYLNGAILGMKRKEVDRKIDEIIAFSEIERHIDTPVKRYSSGMYVRLAFAVAAHLDSDILIADEVLAVGDAAFQQKALGKMNELSTGEGRTVLFVSHNMAQVEQLCNTGILLEKGKLVCYDDITKVENRYFEKMNSASYIELNHFKPGYTDGNFDVQAFYSIDHKNTDLLIYKKHQKLRFVVEFASKNSIPGVTFGITVVGTKGVLFSPNMDESFSVEAGKRYKIISQIDNYLMPGKYSIAFGFNVSKQTSWWGTDICSFEVTYSGRDGYASIFDVDYNFNIEEI